MQELDGKISDAQNPIDRLEQEHHQVQGELSAKVSEAQRTLQDLNMDADKLENVNKSVERYGGQSRYKTYLLIVLLGMFGTRLRSL